MVNVHFMEKNILGLFGLSQQGFKGTKGLKIKTHSFSWQSRGHFVVSCSPCQCFVALVFGVLRPKMETSSMTCRRDLDNFLACLLGVRRQQWDPQHDFLPGLLDGLEFD